MNPVVQFNTLLQGADPLLALAPMQDITDLSLWQLMMTYGGPDVFYTEYFRVHATSRPDIAILRSITENTTGRPVIAQLIGEDVEALVRTARALQRYPIAAVDLNLGCPAPIVCRKNVGGGLLRDVPKIDAILGALRAAITLPFTVKTRLGFTTPEALDKLLPLFTRHGVDLVTVHGRTVQDGYRGRVRYDCIARAVAALPCPVLANGDIYSAPQAQALLKQTGARGLMIGRGAVRNPWLFSQIRRQLRGESVILPTGREVLAYIRSLFLAVRPPESRDSAHVERMKKFLNFIGPGIEPAGQFLYQIRRVTNEGDFFRVCEAFLNHDQSMPLEPFASASGPQMAEPSPTGRQDTDVPSSEFPIPPLESQVAQKHR